MKNNFVLGFFAAVFLSAISGCSITPRYHSFGYHLEWKTKKQPLSMQPKSRYTISTQHKESLIFEQELKTTTEISPKLSPNNYAANDQQGMFSKGSQPNSTLQRQQKLPRMVSTNTIDTTPSQLDKPTQSEVQKIVEPVGIEVLNRRIKIANWLIVLSHGPVVYIFWKMTQLSFIGFWEFLLYLSLLGLATFPIMIALAYRFVLGNKRRKSYYKVNIQNAEAAKLLEKCYSRAVLYLFFTGTIILGIFLVINKFKLKDQFNKINHLEPNNEYVLEQQEKIEWLYDISMLMFYLSLGGFMLRLII